MIRRDIKKAMLSKYFFITVIVLTFCLWADLILDYGSIDTTDSLMLFGSAMKYMIQDRDPYLSCNDAGAFLMGYYLFAFIASFSIIKICGEECETSYMNIAISRIGYIKYIISKFISVFVVGGCSIVVSFLVYLFIMSKVYDMPLDYQNTLINMANSGLRSSENYILIENGYGYIVLLILLLKKSVYIGMWSVVTLTVSVFMKDRTKTIFVTSAIIIVYDCIVQFLPRSLCMCLEERGLFMVSELYNLPFQGVILHIGVMLGFTVCIFFTYAFGVHRRMKNG